MDSYVVDTIAATASYYQAILITRDDMLRDSSEVKFDSFKSLNL